MGVSPVLPLFGEVDAVPFQKKKGLGLFRTQKKSNRAYLGFQKLRIIFGGANKFGV